MDIALSSSLTHEFHVFKILYIELYRWTLAQYDEYKIWQKAKISIKSCSFLTCKNISCFSLCFHFIIFLMESDLLGEWSPEEVCFLRLMLRHVERKSGSQHDFRSVLKLTPAQVVATTNTNNSLSQDFTYLEPEDQTQSCNASSEFKPSHF